MSDPSCRLLALEFVREVGRGSFGEVSAVRATHARGSAGPLLALKRVACRDARQQREVLTELSAVKSATHAGVVRMYEAYSASLDGVLTFFLTMEARAFFGRPKLSTIRPLLTHDYGTSPPPFPFVLLAMDTALRGRRPRRAAQARERRAPRGR